MSQRTLLGMLTPSSNTVLEPVTNAILAGTPDITAHFGRFRVTEISLDDQALGQFDFNHQIEASQLLADAHVQSISWNGTSAGWLGFQNDEDLCAEIQRVTGIPATSSVLALNELFQRTNVTEFALVTPYLDDVQEKVIANYAKAGYRCVAERHLGMQDNFSFSEVTEQEISEMIRAVAGAGPQAIAIICTNLRGAGLAAALEAELEIPIYDSVSTTLWKALVLSGENPARIAGWGKIFAGAP